MLALLVLPWLLAVNAATVEKSVWLLQGTGWEREETALLYALRIYTRDLKVPITISVIPSRGETHDDQQKGAKSRCALDVSLVAWFTDDHATPHLSVLRCASGEEYRLPLVPANDRELAAQTLALKIRGLLTDVTAVESTEEDLLPRPGQTSGMKPNPWESNAGMEHLGDRPSDTSPTVDLPLRANAVRSEEDGPAVVARTQRTQVLEGGLDWLYGATNSFATTRQGLLLRLSIASTRLPLALEMDGAVVTSVANEVGGYQLTVSESPITGVALSARLASPSWTISIGPRLSLHRISAEGLSPDGRTGSTTTAAVGFGALERILLKASDIMSFALSLSNEALVPRQRFTLDGRTRFDVGRFQWALSAGVVVHP